MPTSTVPAWFEADVYFAYKLAQAQEADPTGNWTPAKLRETFAQDGFANDDAGMYAHFVEWGNRPDENVSPNAYFVVADYLQSKADQANSVDPSGNWTAAKIADAIEAAGLSCWDHYTQYGTAEDINPCPTFDTQKYMEAKLTQAIAVDPEGGWTMEKLEDTFRQDDLNPIKHWFLYGQNENLGNYGYTPGDAPAYPIAYEPVVLTAEQTDYVGTDANEDFQGVAGGRDATLLPDTTIDGGAGQDKVTVDMQGDFKGFTADDPLTNVETLELVNNTKSTRTFNAQNVQGVDTVELTSNTGNLNVTNLAYVPENITINDLTGTDKIAFGKGVATGADDAVNLNLNNVGAAAVKANDNPTYAKIDMENVETVTVTSSGANFVDLSAIDDATGITVGGAGNIDIKAVGKNVSSFSAEGASGNVTADLSQAKALNGLTLGNGDDTITIGANGFVNNTPAIDGGEGNDTIIFTDAARIPTVPNMVNVETLVFEGTIVKQISLQNVDGLTGIVMNGDTNKIAIDDMGNVTDFTVTDQGATNKATLNDGSYDLTYLANTAASVKADLEAHTDGSVDIETASGTKLADESMFKIEEATELTFNAAVVNDTVKVGLNADSVETASFNVASGSTLNLYTTADGTGAPNYAPYSTPANGINFLGSVTELTVTGQGVLSLNGNVGSQATNSSELTVNALTSGGITMGNGCYLSAGNITFQGSENNDSVSAMIAGENNVFNMGLGADTLRLELGFNPEFSTTGGDGSISHTNVDMGYDQITDTLFIQNPANTSGAFISVTNFTGGTGGDKVLGDGFTQVKSDLIVANATKVTDLLDAFGIEFTSTTDKLDDTTGVVIIGGNSYAIYTGDGSLPSTNGDVAGVAVVELVGVTDADVTANFTA